MSLSKLAASCQTCPYVETCDHKTMEAVGYLQPTAEIVSAPLIEPIARETRTIHINGHQETVYVDEIEKELYKHLYKGLIFQPGT